VVVTTRAKGDGGGGNN